MHRILNWLLGWRMSKPIDGVWYWVTDGKAIYPAMSDKHASGGWSNLDTWEDWDGRVKAWSRIRQPVAPMGIKHNGETEGTAE